MAGAPELRNPALERMRAGEAALGLIVRLATTGDIALIARATGHDFVFVDMQHSAASLDTAAAISIAALGAGVTSIVRTRRADDLDASRILDAGALGICVPDVESAADARRAVELCKFPPLGHRSVAGPYPALGYRAFPAEQTIKTLNEQTLICCMIETRKGVENVDAIAAVPGVDVLHIGCSDLLADLGKPGQYGDPEVMAAIDRILAAGKKHGNFVGLGGDRDLERQSRFVRAGGRFLTTQSDVSMLSTDATRRTEAIRAAIGQTK
jgi:2-keto-3-deoxy-L-rhamnonate aldolase RhmA